LHSRTGIMLERALIYHLLKDGWGFNTAGPKNVFQDYASYENWRKLISEFPMEYSVEPDLKQKFLEAVEVRIAEAKANGKPDLRSRFDDLCLRFGYFKKNIPVQDRRDMSVFIGELRMILAEACLEALEPDLVILDEFQRFKHLMDGEDEMSRLAQHLFEYKNEEVPTKIILLSATPYKMYTLHHEAEVDNHYEDFIRTVGFLFNSKERTKQFEDKLRQLRNEFYMMDGCSLERFKTVKTEIESDLRDVMIRTERLAHTPDRNGMIKEKKQEFCKVEINDLESFVLADKVARILKSQDMVEFWKSAPYLLNLMDDYVFKKRLKKAIDDEETGQVILRLLKQYRGRMLSGETVRQYEKIEPANAKLRALMQNGLKQGSWRLLWVPASIPYYVPTGVFKDRELRKYTKSLIFSSWAVVPKAIAMMCSYEAERKMVTAFEGARRDYEEERRSRRPLLVFRETEGRPAGMANLGLLYPCLTLAEKIDPLRIALGLMTRDKAPSWTRVRQEIRREVQKLLDEAVGSDEEKVGRADESWYWAALALLDRKFHREAVEAWFASDNNGLRWEETIKTRGERDGDTFFVQHVRRFKEFFDNPEELGPRPRNLVEVLTKYALASPAVTALRSLLRLRNDSLKASIPPVLQSAVTVAAGFRVLYNLPESITLIRSLKDKEPYWERVLEYGVSGNLQAVLDEYVHILKESLGHIDQPYEEIVQRIANEVYKAISIRTISLDFDDIEAAPYARKAVFTRKRIRCRYALRLGEDRSDGDEEVTRSDQVRAAFNSPFRPFLLATTSIGQEGLDFHQYCHSIYHWNLPANPVDLEQREGRIHRYKGLVIRRNLAKMFRLKQLKENDEFRDPWEYLFELAVGLRDDEMDDIVPFWIYEAKGGPKIDRHVPCMPLSRDLERFRDLKQTLALYRMVVGQPRQEDLIEFLKNISNDEDHKEVLADFRIDLSPR
ncbi:helicase-related protein, partial [Acidobacteriota bacterium]